MSHIITTTTSSAAANAAIAKAKLVSGSIIKLDAPEFQKIVEKIETPLLVITEGKKGFVSKSTVYKYLTNYRGLTFYCELDTPLELPKNSEIVVAEKFWMH